MDPLTNPSFLHTHPATSLTDDEASRNKNLPIKKMTSYPLTAKNKTSPSKMPELSFELEEIFRTRLFNFPLDDHESAREVFQYLIDQGVPEDELAHVIQSSDHSLNIWLTQNGHKKMVGEWIISWLNKCYKQYLSKEGRMPPSLPSLLSLPKLLNRDCRNAKRSNKKDDYSEGAATKYNENISDIFFVGMQSDLEYESKNGSKRNSDLFRKASCPSHLSSSDETFFENLNASRCSFENDHGAKVYQNSSDIENVSNEENVMKYETVFEKCNDSKKSSKESVIDYCICQEFEDSDNNDENEIEDDVESYLLLVDKESEELIDNRLEIFRNKQNQEDIKGTKSKSHRRILCDRLLNILNRMKNYSVNKNSFCLQQESNHLSSQNNEALSFVGYSNKKNQYTEPNDQINNIYKPYTNKSNTPNEACEHGNPKTLSAGSLDKENDEFKSKRQGLKETTNVRRDSGIEDDLGRKSVNRGSSVNKGKSSKNNNSSDCTENTTQATNTEIYPKNKLNNKILHLIFSKNRLLRSASNNIEDFFSRGKLVPKRRDLRSYSLKDKKKINRCKKMYDTNKSNNINKDDYNNYNNFNDSDYTNNFQGRHASYPPLEVHL